MHQKISSLTNEKLSRDSIQILKNKIKDELKTAIEKENYIKPEDAKLLNKFLNKIKSDLEKNK